MSGIRTSRRSTPTAREYGLAHDEGLILDSSVIIEAERRNQTVESLLEHVRQLYGDIEIAVCSVTIAELVHGIYRANTPEVRTRRRAFADERHVRVHPVTEETGEIIGQISAEQAAKGMTIPFDDLAIGASALEQGYGVATLNLRHFRLIPNLTVV